MAVVSSIQIHWNLSVSTNVSLEFGCACCPSNICRFIPSIPGYIYAVHNNDVYVNLFMANSSDLKVNGKNVTLKQSTSYPWNGDIKLEVSPKESKFL